MILDRSEYCQLVLHTYKVKRQNNDLPGSLAESTRAKLRDACVIKFRAKRDKEAEKMLREFLCPGDDERPLLPAIQQCEPDKFKALDGFLKRGQGTTDNLNVDILAWLIDCKHRPYLPNTNFQLSEEERAIFDVVPIRYGSKAALAPDEPEKEPADSGTSPGNDDTSSIKDTNEDPDTGGRTTKCTPGTEGEKKEPIVKTPWYKRKKFVLPTIFVLLCGIVLSLVFKPGPPQCMCWTGEKYVESPCNKKGSVKMNKEKMKTFRRIKDEKEITEESINKVHYIKDGEIKYYTEEGRYPEDTTRPLKKLSRYMYEKYFKNKDNSDSNSVAKQK